jgi:signal transduction histidine kinase/CheY-like chemotaxis protein
MTTPLSLAGVRPPETRSVSKRFTFAFIGVVTLLLVGFAVVAIVVDIRRIDGDLQDLLNDTARLAQVSLAVPLWNVDTATITSFGEALLLQDSLVFVEILSEGQAIAVSSRPQLRGRDFPVLAGSSAFLVKTADIVHQGKKIGTVRLAVSREGVQQAILLKVAGILALTVLIIAAISATSMVITRRYVARPLAALQRSAGLIAGGNLDAPIDTTHQDEIGHLARDLNAMRGSLKTLMEERRQNEVRLDDANRTLEQKVEERTRALQSKTHELTRAVEELQALGEVGRAVSSTLDLEKVLTVIVAHAVQITGADGGAIYEYDAPTQTFHLRVAHQMEAELVDALRAHPPRLGEGTVGRAAATRLPVQIPDIHEVETYDARLRDLFGRDDFRARLAVPLLREEEIIGALVVRRRSPGAFSSELSDLLQTFAAQSVLAIQNARLFREIEEKGRELEAASQLKSQFLANMSHELRTPLNAIIGVTEMLHEDATDLDREDEIEPLERVLRAARHLLALINDILDLSKIEAGKMELHLESFSVAPLVEDVGKTIAPLAAKNSNQLVVNCPATIGSMHADQTRIRQALLNLASNASKFTERGMITIAVRRSTEAGRDWIIIAVTDTGIGLTREQMGRLFQDFVQADASTTRKYGGTGLGLAISRRFCQMMGGDIGVASEPGQGSTFTIRLPAHVGAAQPIAGPQSAPPGASAPAPIDAPVILVVDDDPTVRAVTERFLAREGFSVVTANGGVEGLRLARELRPAAITLDVLMPDLDGWSVLSVMKGDPALSDIPVILMTIVDERGRGFSLGVTEFLLKPVDRNRLIGTLRKICGASGRRVLLVDDEDMARRGVRLALEKDGWSVGQAENGKLALEQLAEAQPDIVILDLMMPEMDGFEFVDALRRRSDWRDIPVLVLTAKDLTDDDRRRLNGRVEQILQKNGRDDMLRDIGSTLAKLLDRSRARKAAEGAA